MRRLLQAVCLGLFLYLFFYVSWPYAETFHQAVIADKEWIPVEFFLWLDPLVGLSATIAARTLSVALVGTAAILLANMLVPRGFCGYVCPLGTLIDLFDWLIGNRVPWLKLRADGRWVNLKYYLLAAVIVAAGFGVLLSGFVSAIPVVTRGMAFTLGPLQLGWMRNWSQVHPFTWVEVLSIALFASILLAGLLRKRFWCRYVCPSGALFSLFGVLRLTQRKLDAACTKCGKCLEICPFDAVNEDYTTRAYDCAWCQTCGGVCPTRAIGFGGRFSDDSSSRAAPLGVEDSRNSNPKRKRGTPKQPRPTGQEQIPGPDDGKTADSADTTDTTVPHGRGTSRRGFLLAGAAGTAAAFGIAGGSPGSQQSGPLLRPPGSVPEPQFLDLCIRCGQCFQVCPGPVLQPAGGDSPLETLWTPVVVPTHAGCHQDCNFCTQICPTGAIRPLTVRQKQKTSMGLAIIDEKTCLPHAGKQDCRLCIEECDAAGYRAIELRSIELPLDDVPEGVFSDYELEQMSHIEAPFVNRDACMGCGLCEYRCHAAFVKQEKLLDAAAIRVVPENADR